MRECPECDAKTDEKICPRCGTRTLAVKQAAGDPWIGKVLDSRYRIESVLGRGGMGVVYQATQISMNQRVALKMIRASVVEDISVAKRFQREARAASLLAHPHTIRVFDFGQTKSGDLFLVMEYLTGRTLSQAITGDGPFQERRAIGIIRAVAQSLAEAHAMELVHRDLKPENIMLIDVIGDPDFAKVLDFGIAKFLSGDSGQSSLTKAGVIMGTPYYMAPEQALAKKRITPAVDIYALGVILYEMLCNVKPFDGDSALQILMAHAHEPIPELSEECHTSTGLRALVRRMLAKEPSDRPTAAEIVQICAKLLEESSRITSTKAGISGAPGKSNHAEHTDSALNPTVGIDALSAIRTPGGRLVYSPPDQSPADTPDPPRSRELSSDHQAGPEGADDTSAHDDQWGSTEAMISQMHPSLMKALRVTLVAIGLLLGGGIIAYLAARPGPPPSPPVVVAPTAQVPVGGSDQGMHAKAKNAMRPAICYMKKGSRANMRMYRAKAIDAAADDCPRPSHHRDRQHAMIECHYGSVFFIRTENGFPTCFARAKAVEERLAKALHDVKNNPGAFTIEKDGRNPAIVMRFEGKRKSERIVTITRGDLIAYRTRSHIAGCSEPPNQWTLAEWWAALLTDHFRVMMLGKPPIATAGTPGGKALDKMYRDARKMCPGDGPIPMMVFNRLAKELPRPEYNNLILASKLVPCGWNPDRLSLPDEKHGVAR